MIKKSLALFVVILSVFVTSCTKEPSASFTTSKNKAEIDEEITFTNTSSDGVTYKWEFGDGSTSDDESPKHTYTKAGSYTVVLTAYSKKEKKANTTSSNITINKESYRFTGSIDGTLVNYSTAMEQYGNHVHSTGQIGSPNSTKILKSGISDIDNSDLPGIYVSLGTLTYVGGSIAPSDDFFAFITTGNHPFSDGAVAGVSISYTDINGVVWASDLGSANQSGSNFMITTVENVTQPFGDDYMSFRATFNVKLYNGSGGTKTLTNCYYYASFSNI